jgi:hypothetical protein
MSVKREVRVTKEDIPLIQEIFDVIAKALEGFPETFMRNDKFGILAMTAIINMACRIGQRAGVPKDEFLRTITKIWDDKLEAAKRFLN